MNCTEMRLILSETIQQAITVTGQTLSEWADNHIVLSSEASAEPGKWRTARTPYLREPMDCILDPSVSEVVMMTGSQIGKTSLINVVLGYFSVVEPSPILMVLPTLDLAQHYSSTRLATLIRDSPTLAAILPAEKADGNKVLSKRFPGGFILIAGANSPVMLASTPIRVLLQDEVDRFPVEVGDEGDPMELAKKRTSTYADRKLVVTSTPTVKDASRIEALYELSDKRRFHLPCIGCGEYQILTWSQVKWDSDPANAYFVCKHCGLVIDDNDKLEMLQYGKWIAEKPFAGRAGFHLNELYSPWRTFGDVATAFYECKSKPEKLKVWTNTSMGETWYDKGEQVNLEDISKRGEIWVEEVPRDVLLLTAGVDVQKDRIECEVVGWSYEEENWSIEYKVFYGDPTMRDVWDELKGYLLKDFKQDGFEKPIRISATCIDSSDNTKNVYAFCKENIGNRFFPVKGHSASWKPAVSRPTKSGIDGTYIHMLGVDTIKELIYARLKISSPGAGFCHFPANREEEYFKQLAAEEIATKIVKGYKKRYFVKVRARNEALDCRTYAYASLLILNPDWRLLQKKRTGITVVEPPDPIMENGEQPPDRKGLRVFQGRKGGFISKYRRKF